MCINTSKTLLCFALWVFSKYSLSSSYINWQLAFRKGLGTISAAGGQGWGGGGGGRISLHSYSVQDVKVTVHGMYWL